MEYNLGERPIVNEWISKHGIIPEGATHITRISVFWANEGLCDFMKLDENDVFSWSCRRKCWVLSNCTPEDLKDPCYFSPLSAR